MGLDMYLDASYFIGGKYNTNVDDIVEFDDEKKFSDRKHHYKFRVGDIESITTNVAYWRKANAIHKWFVDNCANGVDDCRRMYVDRSKLEELRNLCVEVIANPERAPELLPTESGFFFGSTNYDEWYMKDIEYTIEVLSKVLDNEDLNGDPSFYYQASW